MTFGITVLALGWALTAAAAKDAKVDPAALERTRKELKMLDDIYKTTIVLITDKYVHDKEDFPAGGAAVALFDAMQKKGWHEVRLLDATGKPHEKKNAPADDFEKEAVKKLKAGGDYYEQVVEKDGKPFLRAATPVPVVMKKCALCHEHYNDAKKGEAIGALSYTIRIE
jgi:hypothetical protein